MIRSFGRSVVWAPNDSGVAIAPDTAIRLAKYCGTSEEFWMNLQSNYELRLERRLLREKVAAITPLKVA